MTKLLYSGACVLTMVASILFVVTHDHKTRKIHAVWDRPGFIWQVVTTDGIGELFKGQ